MNKRHPVRGRRKHIARWVTIIKYGLLTLVGIWLYRCGAAYAFQQRGYFALFLPFIYWSLSQVVRGIIRDVEWW